MRRNTTEQVTMDSLQSLLDEMKLVVEKATEMGVDRVEILLFILASLKSVMGGNDVLMQSMRTDVRLP